MADHWYGRCGAVIPARGPGGRPPVAAGPAPNPIASDNSRGWAYQLCLNNVRGTCCEATAANSLAQSIKLLGNLAYSPDTDPASTVDVYRHGGASPAFDPATGAGDNGSVPDAVKAYLLSHGGWGNRLLGWGNLRQAYQYLLPQDLDLTADVIAGAGGCELVFELTAANLRQTNTFTYDPGPPVAGHSVWAVGVEPPTRTVLVVSWGRLMRMTWEFFLARVVQRSAVLWPWHLNGPTFGGVVNAVHLADRWRDWTGGPFPRPLPAMVPVDPNGRYHVADGTALRYAAGPGWAVVRGPVPGGAPWVLDELGRVAYFP